MLCFRSFLVAKNFLDKKVGGGLSKLFVEFLVVKKFMEKKGEWEYRKFPSKIFCLKVPKSLVGDTFSLSLFSGIEKFYASEGYVTIFRRIFFVSQYRNIS